MSDRRIERRSFVRAGVALAAFVIPGWVAACRRAEEPTTDADPIATLLAKSNARDVLVLRVDDDAQRAEDLGNVVGVFLVRAHDVQLAPLAVVDIACATSAEFARIAPALAAEPEVRAVRIARDRSVHVAVRGDPPRLPGSDETVAIDVPFERAVRARHDWFARQVASSVGDDEASIARRADEERAQVPGWSSALGPTIENAARWPWNARLAAARADDESKHWNAALARVVDARWKTTPPSGSAWVDDIGCGTSWDPPPGRTPHGELERLNVLCGIGHVSEVSSRFLHFYTREELGT